MSRIAVVTSSPPFAEGGHLVIARCLVQALREAGHRADLLLTPQNRFGRQASAYLATWCTDVGLGQDGDPIDQVISFRYPSYAVRHPVHVCWLNHRMREYYDLWDRFSATLTAASRVKERARRALLHLVDRYLLTRNVTRLYTISRTVQARLLRWGGIPAEVLYPPPPQRPYRCDRHGDFIFAVSRLTLLKRLDLLVRALAEPEARGVCCAIAGDGPEAGSLAALVRDLGLEGRVRLIGSASPGVLIDQFARCRAVCFPTFDEDYGFVTVEAFSSEKAVVTCKDSGGPAELVKDGVNGFVCEPTPAALARSLRALMDDEGLAARMGQAGHRLVSGMSWEAAVARLVVV